MIPPLCKPGEWMPPVVSNRPRGGPYHTMRLALPRSFPVPAAGAFVMISTGCGSDIPLRRPMAVCDIVPTRSGRILTVLYAVAGCGTKRLTRVQRGDRISLLGPIGNGFSKPRRGERFLVVAGGIGIAPFLLWARQLSPALRRGCGFLFGFMDRSHASVASDFGSLGVRPSVAVEGPGPVRGTAVDLLEKELARKVPECILTCGPPAMMDRVADMARRLRIPCEASLEARMACGVGACLSCVTKFGRGEGAQGYALVCQDGPVFDAAVGGA